MTHRFDLSVLETVDISQCTPGFYLKLSVFAGPSGLILKMDSEKPEFLFYAHMNGENEFNAIYRNTPTTKKTPLIGLNGGNLILELPDRPHLVGNKEDLGVITICEGGAYLTAHRFDDGGEKQVIYISLRSFKRSQHLPSENFGAFETWRLTTAEENPGDRTILASHGDWT